MGHWGGVWFSQKFAEINWTHNLRKLTREVIFVVKWIYES